MADQDPLYANVTAVTTDVRGQVEKTIEKSTK